MGQYYKIINVDKREFIEPHAFGDGAKLLEFGSSGCGAMTALAILLADGNNHGGGDLRSDDPVIGSWARDRIVVAGDYADAEEDSDSLYNLSERPGEYKDVSKDVLFAMCEDEHLLASLKTQAEYCSDLKAALTEKRFLGK